MHTIYTPALSETQSREIARLTECCQNHDKIMLSYPSDESGDGCCHYLLYEEGGSLTAALSMIPLDGGLAECSAFTHPAYRRQGYFSCLLNAAMERYEACDILFAVPESCPDTMAVLSALGANMESREHLMVLEMPHTMIPSGADTGSVPLHHAGLALFDRIISEDTGYDIISSSHAVPGSSVDEMISTATWTLACHGTPIGQCLITPVSDTCVCLHHLEITAALRGKGYGSRFLSLLLPRLAASGICKIMLQVSGGNPAAIALYKKTGFRITETLSYYCY